MSHTGTARMYCSTTGDFPRKLHLLSLFDPGQLATLSNIVERTRSMLSSSPSALSVFRVNEPRTRAWPLSANHRPATARG